jgi:hypothetical protein
MIEVCVLMVDKDIFRVANLSENYLFQIKVDHMIEINIRGLSW